MTKFELPSFGTPANSKQYRDNWDSVFGKKDKKKKAPENDSGEPNVHSEEIDVEETSEED
jgi:hypothetical protein